MSRPDAGSRRGRIGARATRLALAAGALLLLAWLAAHPPRVAPTRPAAPRGPADGEPKTAHRPDAHRPDANRSASHPADPRTATPGAATGEPAGVRPASPRRASVDGGGAGPRAPRGAGAGGAGGGPGERAGGQDRWRAARRARIDALRAPVELRREARERALAAMRPFWDLRRPPVDAAERARAAEAAFRSGELAAWIGQVELALEAYAAAARHGTIAGYGSRARLERAHVLRRAGRADEALDAYASLALDERTPPGRRDPARTWAGRLEAARGDLAAARRLWRACAEGTGDPVHRTRAWDELVLAWVEAGDLEAAAGCLAQAYARLAPLADECTGHGARVERALQRMRCVARLAEAVRERRARATGSVGDAAGGAGAAERLRDLPECSDSPTGADDAESRR